MYNKIAIQILICVEVHKMEYSKALSYALSGEAIFLLGSGFSVGATNKKNETLPTGKKLATALSRETNLDEDTPLDIVSQEYIDSVGEKSLIEFLKSNYEVTDYEDYYNVFAKIPELKIYTTNYDNLIETVCISEKKKIKSYDLSQKLNKADKKNMVMHLNGYIGTLQNEIPNTFYLTHLSYNQTNFYNSSWYPFLKDELHCAQAIFIIGLSFKSDIDIRRIISDPVLNDKCFIVESPDISEKDYTFLSKYGHVIQNGIKQFCLDLNTAIPADVDYHLSNYKFKSFKEFKYERSYNKSSDNEIFDMFFLGKTYRNTYFRDETGKFVSLVNRKKLSYAINQIESGKSTIIHSDLGNGKTIFINELLRSLRNRKIFFIQQIENDKLLKEINILCDCGEKIIIIIDPYNTYLRDFEKFKNFNLSNIQFILLARTAMHENCANIVYDIIDQMKSQNVDFANTPINLNTLEDDEIEEFNNLLTTHGFWGDKISLSDEGRIKFIKTELKSTFQNALLYIFKSNEIKGRFDNILKDISKDKKVLQILILSFINQILELNFDFNDFNTIFDSYNIDKIIKQRKDILGELVDINSNKIQVKSSIISKSLITSEQIKKEDVLETLLLVTNKLDKLYDGNKKYRVALKNLASASYLSFIFDYQLDSKILTRYYEKIKENKFNKNNLFFWEQYAITCVNIQDFPRAKKYFETSYSLAKKVGNNFSTFQIDNHYARYIIENQIFTRNYKTAISAFIEAHNLLIKKYINDDIINDRFYQFRVAVTYKEYYDIFYDSFDIESKKIFINLCNEMYTRLKVYIKERNENELRGYILDCKRNLEYIIRDTKR